MAGRRRPRLAVFKFASCDGCQLSLLDAEDELLAVCVLIDIAHFAEASSRLEEGPYDVTLVEGSITRPEDAERLRKIRQQTRYLVTIGACATAGGIQALRQWGQIDQWVSQVYPRAEFIDTLATSTPIAAHVHVDLELHGCPIDHRQLVAVLVEIAEGRQPRLPRHGVCLDCKLKGTVCHVVARGIPCLGPVTRTGCGAVCPAYDRGCYGCHGPSEPANMAPLLRRFQELGSTSRELVPLLRNFHAAAPAFRQAAEDLMNRDAMAGEPS